MPSTSRDDFSKSVVRALQERAGNHCANPKCRCLTSGPNDAPHKASRIGVAAHVTAAAAGGPRYESARTPEDRRSIENGIWLCQNCARLIDVDPANYSVELLLGWRESAELWARDQIEGGRGFGVQEDELFSIEGWPCLCCGTVVPNGHTVCLGCHAEVIYGATRQERQEALNNGLLYGGIVGALFMFLLPSWLGSQFSLNLAPGWGLGAYSILLVGVLAFGAAITLVNRQEAYYRRNTPRFFRQSIAS